MPETGDILESPRMGALRPLLVAAGVAALIAGAMGALWLFFRAEVPVRIAEPPKTFPAPQVTPHQGEELRALTVRQKHRLAGYRWIDHDNKIVAIPIDRAMAIEARRGPDGYKPIVGTAQAPQGGQAQ